MTKPRAVPDPLVVEAVAHRRAMGRSQASVADAIGTTQSAVSEMERGITVPTIHTMRRYLRALGLDLEQV